jgi:ABC-type multidrug transport system fused ATPase/permease subunit
MSDSAALSSGDNNVSSAASSAAAPLLGQSDAVRVQIVPESSESESKLLETPMDSGDEDLAIRLEGAYKHYGSGRNKSPVLIGLDMSVPRGKIYGLLGPSGCGKTTLLKCIVGKLGVDGGIVHVFGEPPGGGNNGVPGAQVGYMPQELALFGEFNIEETLTYFRRIYGELHLTVYYDHTDSCDHGNGQAATPPAVGTAQHCSLAHGTHGLGLQWARQLT